MAKIRKQSTKAGKMLQVDYFHTHKGSGRRIDEGVKTNKSKAQMDEENRKKAIRKFVLLVNANFDDNNYFASFDYQPEFAPFDYDRAVKDFNNYISRIKRLMNRKGSNPKKLKYAYSCQEVTYKSGLYAGRSNFHFHAFIKADGLTKKELKDLWPFGTKGNISNYDPYRFGPEAAAKYMVKTKAGRKMYKCSKNLDKPYVDDIKDGQISERKLRELCEQRVDDREYWERRYPSYNFVKCYPSYNEHNGHWYLSVVMYKKSTNQSYYEKSRKRALSRVNTRGGEKV